MIEKWNFKIDPRIFFPLGIDLYSTISGALMELYANAWDGKAINVITTIDKNTITVQDDGEGMTKDTLKDVYLWVAVNKRMTNGNKFSFNCDGKKIERYTIGNKGIGKLAGFGIANVMKILSWTNGQAWKLTIDMKEIQTKRDITEVDLQAIEIPFNKEVFFTPSGTIISLEDAKIDFRNINENHLRAEIAKCMPISDDFAISINDKKCERSDVKFQTAVNFQKRMSVHLNEKIYDLGIVTASFGLASARLDSHVKAGILIKVRGKGIGEPRLFDMEKNSHMAAYIGYLTGEISSSALDHNDTGLITAGRDDFIKHNENWQAFEALTTQLLNHMLINFDRRQRQEQKTKELKKISLDLKNITRFFSQQHKEKIEKTQPKKGKPGPKKKYTKRQQEIDINKLRIRIRNQTFHLTYIPTSSEEPECIFDEQKAIININTAHPMFNYGKKLRCSPIQIFKAIAFEYAQLITQNTPTLLLRDEYNMLNRNFAKYMLQKKAKDEKAPK